MRIRVLGGGWYGCSIALALKQSGIDVELHERAGELFTGASGGNPARLHQGAHYPRNRQTREHCQDHHAAFMHRYGFLTRGVPVNLYAIAAHDSLVDFGTYCQVLKGEIEFIRVRDPAEFGLKSVEGAILTGERHILVGEARAYFARELADVVRFHVEPCPVDDAAWDWTIDCTFCAMDAAGVERYEPCLTAILSGPTDKAVTIMDGPFPSLYPWDEQRGLVSLTSASLTPLARCRSRQEAEEVIAAQSPRARNDRAMQMIQQMEQYYPDVTSFELARTLLSIRAQPRSGSDARLVDVVHIGSRALRVRAGKIDAVLLAEDLVRSICSR
jgi:hypothetical protein